MVQEWEDERRTPAQTKLDVMPCFPAQHLSLSLSLLPIPIPCQTQLHTTEAPCGFLDVPCAPSTGRGSPPWRQELLGAVGPRHSFSRCTRSSCRDLNAKRQRGQRKPPMSNTLESRAGGGSLGGATLPGRGGLPAGLVPRDGLNACTDLLAAVAAVFEDTVAMLDAGLGREGHASDPGHSHYLPRALEWGKKCR